jgi:hypothetical protein
VLENIFEDAKRAGGTEYIKLRLFVPAKPQLTELILKYLRKTVDASA